MASSFSQALYEILLSLQFCFIGIKFLTCKLSSLVMYAMICPSDTYTSSKKN